MPAGLEGARAEACSASTSEPSIAQLSFSARLLPPCSSTCAENVSTRALLMMDSTQGRVPLNSCPVPYTHKPKRQR